MGALFIYILKSSVCLILFYLFFRLLLSKETFHRFNRIALLGVLFLSLALPWIEVTTTHQAEVHQTFLTIEQLVMMAEVETAPTGVGEAVVEVASVSWIQVILLLYLLGIVVFACHHLYSLSCLLRLVHCGKREKMAEGIILVVHERTVAPFSWMKYIVISRKDIEENGREILIHETAHIRNRHSIDLLIADICIFFQWFNPGAWLLKQELQNIHEYEADETVIRKGVNAKEYQLLLIKKAVGTRLYSMANSFNHSKLKKRITMMLKEKSSPWARLKYLYVLPLAAIAVTAFARPEISEKAEEISAVKVNDLANYVQENVLGDAVKVLKDTVKVPKSEIIGKNAGIGGRVSKDNEEVVVFEIVEQMPEYPGGMNALSKYLKDKTESSSVKDKAGGSVIVGFTVTETGKVSDVKVSQSDQSILNKEAERIVREMPDWKPGKQRNRPVPVKYSISVRFADVRFAEGKQPLVLVDGKESSMDYLNRSSDMIESFTVLKDNAASIYGARGANGVILVNTKKAMDSKRNAVPDYPVTGTVVDELGRPKAGVSVVVPNTTYSTLTDENGYFQLKVSKGDNLWLSFVGYKPVRAAATSTMMIRLEREFISLFPELAGTIKGISSSSGVKVTNGVTAYGIGGQPLIIIDGKEATQKDALSKIPPECIKSISVLKDKASRAIYGDKGKNGVILVDLLTEVEYQAKKNQK